MDKEYIFSLITTVKLTEKQIAEAEAELARWEKRLELARSRGAADLIQPAEEEAARLREKIARLRAEAEEHRAEAAKLRAELPGLAARERSVDPDLLEQELLILAGRSPGDEGKAAADRAFGALEQESAADDALASLKAKMGLAPSAGNAADAASGSPG